MQTYISVTRFDTDEKRNGFKSIGSKSNIKRLVWRQEM